MFASADDVLRHSCHSPWRDLGKYASQLLSIDEPDAPPPKRARHAPPSADMLVASSAATPDHQERTVKRTVSSSSPVSPFQQSSAAPLTAADHAFVMSYSQLTSPSASDVARYAALVPRIEHEQAAYLTHLSTATASDAAATQRLSFLDARVDAAVRKRISHRRDTALSLYPRYYETVWKAPIEPVKSDHKEEPTLRHAQSLFRTGHCVKLKTTCPTHLPSDIDAGSGTAGGVASADLLVKHVMPVVSEDPVVAHLLASPGISPRLCPDLVLSSSALSALIAATVSGAAEYDIPIVARVEAGRKVVFLDKPIPHARHSVREKNTLYYKAAVGATCMEKEGGLQFASLEAMLVDHEGAKEEDGHVNEAEEGEARPPLSPLRSLDASVSSPGNNLTYNLWTFGGLSVLIRCRIHGVVDDPSSSYKQKRMIGLGVKVHMGGHVTSHVGGIGTLDAVTEEERARWWVGTYIRPDAHMVVANVDPSSASLLSVTRLDMPTLLAPPAQTMQGAAARFDPTASCAKMFPLLEKLAGVAPGSYVLSRAAGAQYAVLRKSVEAQDGDRTLFDLHQRLQTCGATSGVVQFALPEWKGNPGQIPYTFPVHVGEAVAAGSASTSPTGKNKKNRKGPHKKGKKGR